MRASAAKRPDVKLCGDLIRASHSLAIKLGGSPFAAGEGGTDRRDGALSLPTGNSVAAANASAETLVKYKTICQTRKQRKERREMEGKKKP